MFSLVNLLALVGTITLVLTNSVEAMICVVAILALISITFSILIRHITCRLRKDPLFKLFNIIRKKSGKNQKTDEEADEAIQLLYSNNAEVASPIYIFVNESKEIDLLAIALLRAALRYFNAKIEIEMHGQGYLKMEERFRKRLEISTRKMRFFEKNIAYTGLLMIKKLDLLILECIGATRTHCLLLKANGGKIPKFKPLFFIVQKTKKDPRRLLFPIPYE